MSREKQISEIRNDLCEADKEFCKFCRGRRCQECEYYFARTDCKNQILAEKLTDKGYRKVLKVAEEIFAEIDKIRLKELHKCETLREQENEVYRKYWEGGEHSLRQLAYWIAELKKKYTKQE